MNIRRLLMSIGIILAWIAFLLSGYLMESPINQRQILIISLSVILLVLLIMSLIFSRREEIQMLNVLGMTGFLLYLEMNSQFSMNYFYHSMYFVIAFIGIIYLSKRHSAVIAPLVVLASFAKFVQLVIIETTFGNIATFIFFGLVQVLMIFIIFVAKAYYNESVKTGDLYRELLDAYGTLDEYSREIKILSAKEERTSIARDLHDTLGHELTGLIMQLELANYAFESKEHDDGIGHLLAGIDTARGSLTQVREIVNTLKNQEKLIFTNQSIVDLINEYSKRTGIVVTLHQDETLLLTPDLLLILLRVIQEALTNTAKHGKSDHIEINIRLTGKLVEFKIYDYQIYKIDPIKAKSNSLIKGNGLIGMEERIHDISGSIHFKKIKGKGSGFYIEGSFPIRDDELESEGDGI